jgi:hypothetical protein
MDHIMAVLLNGVAQLEYDRTRALPPHQAAYLDKMDAKMDKGIELDHTFIEQPDLDTKARFIAANLLSAIKNDDEAMAASLCTWLANRLPELKQVKYVESGDEIMIDMVFDEAYQKQVAVQLTH